MSALAFFTSTAIAPQSASQGYGVESTDKFRVSSSFTISSNTKAYAVVQGTILLQQQATDADKVNLILRPHNQKELKLPVKYIIYRGLSITDFIDNNDLTDPANKVNTSGSELLAAMQAIQQGRAPGDDIQLETLFGNDLTPANNKNIDDFFFKSLAPSSQLFTIDCGIELGNFATGEIGIEIVLENPEFFVDVELAKEPKHERDVSGITDATQKKWEKDLVRHFVDPAAFYGLHYDIKGGIEYRDNNGDVNDPPAETKTIIYNTLLTPFDTKNNVYLDIRNENGYSYNYYGNYVGTGTDADKELEIGPNSTGLTKKEYYTNGWAMHIVDVITPGNNEENEFSIALRINDNEKPLLAGWNVELSPNSAIDPPLSNDTSKRVYFTDDIHLLPTPIPSSLPAFTNTITLKVPNLPSETEQLATVVKLDYIKQLRLNDNADSYPQENSTDYLFGPINVDIPWDSDDHVQWISSSHQKFFDGWLNQGLCIITHSLTIKSINVQNNEIVLEGLVADLINIGDYSSNRAAVNSLVLGFQISGKTEKPSSNETIITISGIIDINNSTSTYTLGNSGLNINHEFYTLNYYNVIINYKNQEFYINDVNLMQYSNYANIYSVYIYFKVNSTPTKIQVPQINYNNNTNTTTLQINPTTPLTRSLAFLADIGMVTENNPDSIDNDNIIFYAFPNYYYLKTGGKDSSFFNYKGGTYENGSLFDYLKKQDIGADIVRSSIETSGNTWYVLSFNTTSFLNNPNFLLLAITKNELQTLKDQTSPSYSEDDVDFSDYHIKQFKLKKVGRVFIDNGGEAYFQYRLVVSGLDVNGNYKETPAANGLRIFSKDGQLFSSSAYAENVQVSGAKFILNFRRRDDYAEKGGHYGFDWMRPEYIAETDPITSRGGICIAHNSSITKQEAQDQLKQEYTPIEINGIEYYVPWLSMYKNHASIVAGGNPINPTEHEVRLKLEMDTRLFSNEGSVWFDVPEGIEIILKDANSSLSDELNIIHQPLKASKINSTIAVVKCTQKSNLDRKIYAYDENNNLVGALNILKNNENYICDVRFVKVNLTGILTGKDVLNSLPIDYKIDYTAKTSENYINNQKVGDNPKLNLEKYFDNWEIEVNNSENNANDLLHQSLVNYSPLKIANGNIDFNKQITIDFGNYTIGNILPTTSPTNKFKNHLLGVQINGNLIFNDFTENDLMEFINILNSIYINNYPDNNESVTAFIFPCDVIGKFEPETTGASNGIDNAKCILLMRQATFEKDKTLSHEISHSLGLLHTFQIGGGAIHSFLKYHTENIMDYIYPKNSNLTPVPKYIFSYKEYGVSYFRWQIEKIQIDNDLK